eukprot:265023-Heterocapsa_arctica.AAC.1
MPTVDAILDEAIRSDYTNTAAAVTQSCVIRAFATTSRGLYLGYPTTTCRVEAVCRRSATSC